VVAVPLVDMWYTASLREFPPGRTAGAVLISFWFGLSLFDLLTGHRWLDWLYSDEDEARRPAEPTSAWEGGVAADLKLVDAHLRLWSAFAQGCSELSSSLASKELEEDALTRLLVAGDRRAPGRLVFYAVVQVGGFIPVDSDLGRAAARVLGSECPITTLEDGRRCLFAGDLYFWWQTHGRRYETFALLDDWLASDFARRVAVPMYASACNRG
jgi:hypothetical protein